MTVDNMAAHRAAIPRPAVQAVLIAATVILALTAISTQRAHGDAALQSSSPAAGSVPTSRPTQIELTFNEEALTIGTKILVEGPAGSATDVDLEVDLPDGDYTVEWRTVSGDGHPVNDTYTFTITRTPETTPTPTAGAPPPGTAATSPAAASTTHASINTPTPGDIPSSESTPRTAWWVVGFAVVAVLAGIGSWATSRRGRDL